MNIKPLLVLILSALFLSNCSTDFELEAEWKDIPIVYSFISVQDSIHYVRVEKAFLEPGGNALEIAKIADSLYYDNLTVEIEKMETGKAFVLERVLGSEVGLPKEEGLFASEPHYLYRIPASELQLEEGEPVRLIINRGDEIEPAIAETRIVGEIDSSRFNPPNRIATTRYGQVVRIAFNPDDNARIFDIRFRFFYREKLPGEGQFSLKSVDWVISPDLVRSQSQNNVDLEADWENFYRSLARQIPEVNGADRIFSHMDLLITGAGNELYEFIRVNRANTGITSAQSVPTYTNLEGGLGIFTSRYTLRRKQFELVTEARDSLRSSIYTNGLNFR